MLEQIMMDGEPLEAGDKVYSLTYGWVIIKELQPESTSRPILFETDEGLRTICLKSLTYHQKYKTRDLFWQKPEIVPPPKLKKKKVWDWFAQNSLGNIYKLIGKSEKDMMDCPRPIKQKIEGTEREVER